MIAEDDRVRSATPCTAYRGDGLGMPPTGKEVAIPVIVIYRLSDGKIVEPWLQAYQVGMMQQPREASATV